MVRENPFKPINPNASADLTSVKKATISETVAPVIEGAVTYYGEAASLVGGNGVNGKNKNSGMGGKSNSNIIIDQRIAWDIAQSHFFTVQIYSPRNTYYPYPTGLHDKEGKAFAFASGRGVWENYIPLRSMNFNYTSYDNMNIPFGIFGDFPLLHRKKVTSINFSCYDTDHDDIEKALKYWEQQCFPYGMYVAYLEDVAATLKYTSYDVKGNKNFVRELEVIPASSVNVSRSYEENAAKMLNFSVVAVGAKGASAANGDQAWTGEIRERGYGTPGEWVGPTYERQVSGMIWDKNQGFREPTAMF